MTVGEAVRAIMTLTEPGDHVTIEYDREAKAVRADIHRLVVARGPVRARVLHAEQGSERGT